MKLEIDSILNKSEENFLYETARFFQPYNLFFKLNKNLPSVKLFHDIDFKAMFADFFKVNQQKEYKTIISETVSKNDSTEIHMYLIMVRKDLFLVYDSGHSDSSTGTKLIYCDTTPEEEVEKLSEYILKWKLDATSNHLNLLSKENYGLELINFTLETPEIEIDTNYNPDFAPINKLIIEKLAKKSKGIVLLHGIPGTGKTTYIRFLISQLKKKIIYIPTDLAPHVASPDFISLLIANPNSILVIEDAENVIGDRNSNKGAAVANLLNLSDGLLSDCLNIQVICTFNTVLEQIDPALLRKGRVIAKYEFSPLEKEKTQGLFDKLNIEFKADRPYTLAEIYNFSEQNFADTKRKIGF